MPVDRISENVRASWSTVEDFKDLGWRFGNWSGIEGSQIPRDVWEWVSGDMTTAVDDFTWALMLNMATRPVGNSIIQAAFLNTYSHGSAGMEEWVETFLGPIYGAEEEKKINYNRYFQGEMVVVKGLLSVFSAKGVMRILGVVEIGLMIWCLVLVFKRFSRGIFFSMIASLIMINPITVVLSPQYAAVFIITMATMIAVMRRNRVSFKDFLWMGILIAYFDFLTYPMFGLVMLLCLMLLMNNFSLRQGAEKVAKMSMVFMTGYLGMFVGKWCLATIITGENVFLNGITAGAFRVNGDGIGWTGVSTIMVIMLSLMVWAFWGTRVVLNTRKKKIALSSMAFLLVGLLPVGWMMLFRNHTVAHIYMAYRIFAGTIFATLCFVERNLKALR